MMIIYYRKYRIQHKALLLYFVLLQNAVSAEFSFWPWSRNQHQEEVGFFEEIGFEQFLMVMSHFRPPTLKMTEEEKQALRKEKLRCESLLAIFGKECTQMGTPLLLKYQKTMVHSSPTFHKRVTDAQLHDCWILNSWIPCYWSFMAWNVTAHRTHIYLHRCV